jgi:hypothetical protein
VRRPTRGEAGDDAGGDHFRPMALDLAIHSTASVSLS